MNRLGAIGRILLTVSTSVVVVALALPATVALGASPNITFGDEYDGLRMGGPCLNGHAPSSANLHLVWKSSAGAVKANVQVQATDSGYWSYCSEDGDSLVAGDKLKATVGASTRMFGIPDLTATVDRVNGVFRGRAPAGTTAALWFIHRGCCADFVQDAAVTADGAGNWVYDNEGWDVDGYEAHVDWRSPKGDFVTDYGAAAEATVRINRSIVAGYGDPGSHWKLALWDPASGNRKGVASGVTDEWGSFSGVFMDTAGNPVNVLPGDKVVGPALASDLKFIARDIQASANVATDFVTGTCGNTGGRARVDILRNSHYIGGTAFVDLDEAGNFTVDFNEDETLGYSPANIQRGDRILVTCGTLKGDFVDKFIRVP